MALTVSLGLTLSARQTKAQDLIAAGLVAAPSLSGTQTWADGSATGLFADRLFVDTRSLTASQTEDLDLAGVLVDVFGVTLTFVKVCGIYVKAAAANNVANNLIIGNGTAPFIGPFGAAGASEQRLPPGGQYLATHPGAGWAVTPTTGDILKMTNGAGTNTIAYDIAIWGKSA